jgi:alpha-D-xyloside xylohydrolase
VLHLDTAWFKDDWNCDLKFSEERFPDPEKHTKQLKEQGFRISLWQYNFIPPREDNCNYLEALEKGYFAKNDAGEPYQMSREFPGISGSWTDDCIIDFSNPEARAWYCEKLSAALRTGASAIKTDFGEGVPEGARYACIDGRFFHNLYSLAYNYTAWKATKDTTGDDIVWARSGTAGSQRYPLHWGGDSQCTYSGLAGTLRAALSAGMSGISYFSHDIGGFIGKPTPELYVRWAQLGLFSSHARCHGCGDRNSREPWSFGEEAERIFRKYAKLRYSLMPYIYGSAMRCVEQSLPLARPLVVEYQDDPTVWNMSDEFLFGDGLLIAPIFGEENTRRVYLPEGNWTNWWSRDRICGGQWVEVETDLETLPIFVREGAIIPMGPLMNYVDEKPTERIELLIAPFESDGQSEFTVPVDDELVKVTYIAVGGKHVLAIGKSKAEFIVTALGDSEVVVKQG